MDKRFTKWILFLIGFFCVFLTLHLYFDFLYYILYLYIFIAGIFLFIRIVQYLDKEVKFVELLLSFLLCGSSIFFVYFDTTFYTCIGCRNDLHSTYCAMAHCENEDYHHCIYIDEDGTEQSVDCSEYFMEES